MSSTKEIYNKYSRIIANLIKAKDVTNGQVETFLKMDGSFASDIICIGSNPTLSVLPVIRKLKLKLGSKCRVGVGSNISSGVAALTAFEAGADFVLTGSINQLANEADISLNTKNLVSKLSSTDMINLPCFGMNMFDIRDSIPIVKRGTMFASYVTKLYELFQKYECFEQIPVGERNRIEERLLKATFDDYFCTLENAMKRDPIEISRLRSFENLSKKEYNRIKMALVFASMLRNGLSNCGGRHFETGNKMESLIWCSSSIGAYNGLYPPKERGITQICDELMNDMLEKFSK